ncbi:MAG: DUF2723 domain-containing protein [Bacteroidales bacterium]|nr:DUF2723 domain-containing protein [Bacteroidales bacterium]
MDKKKFGFWNRVSALAVFAVSALTYLATIEPTSSFWDCGEFIASSYKLEVGHPPGNPVFQLFARIFTIFGDNMHAAMLVNSLSAICSALTVLLLYLTIVFFVKRLFERRQDGGFTLGEGIAILGSGTVGALAYCFSDTFWFSAVEGEVYAMSSLFTALVFWMMTKWYECADQPYANRWIVLISFMMGLSIGVQLLNLLAIPALVFLYYYKKREDGVYSFRQCVGIMLVSIVILGVILFGIIPWVPKMAAYVDLFFVNVLNLPFNSGAVAFMSLLLAGCFAGLFVTLKKGKVFWNTVLLCTTSILVGFSLFSIVVIRSNVKTPTNENQPDNAFTLVRYLSREQYGSAPLIYGEFFGAAADYEKSYYYTPVDGKYFKAEGAPKYKYDSDSKMLFPRMWSSGNEQYRRFYEQYTGGKGRKVKGSEYRKPTQAANLHYFFDYQLGWMYWRYFMWNFVGRQNDIHGATPHDLFAGNWESGIGFMDRIRLGDQSDAPAILGENKGKNHYFFLPLILGLLGLFFQLGRDKRGCWLIFLLFFMTGIAIVVYLNQAPYQVRERDYAYAGSFYAFSIWIGLAVAAIWTGIRDALGSKHGAAFAAAVSLACLGVPALMACENWDDHDRSNRYTAVEMARNYLASVGENGILVTHGDNDTFPLWYAQEVEEVRPDVRIVNTSLLGTDWHIEQMKYAINRSAPLDITVPLQQYLYGTNEIIYIYDTRNLPVPISDVMAIFKHPEIKLTLENGVRMDFIVSRKIVVPVNRENVLKSGILSEKFAAEIPDSIVLEIPQNRNFIYKSELFFLDLLSNYQWDRPIHFLGGGGDIEIGIKSYLMSDGYSSHLVPIRNSVSSYHGYGKVDTDHLYRLITEEFSFDSLARTDYYIDYQNIYTHLGVMPVRGLAVNSAEAFMKAGENERALDVLDRFRKILKREYYPYETVCMDLNGNDYYMCCMIEDYFKLGQKDTAIELAGDFIDDVICSADFFAGFGEYGEERFKSCGNIVFSVCDVLEQFGQKEMASLVKDRFYRTVPVSE